MGTTGQLHGRQSAGAHADRDTVCQPCVQAAGVPVAVCSAATKSAVEFVLGSLLGQGRFSGLDLFMAGDDVKEKKPDPTIYKVGGCLPLCGWAVVAGFR